MYCDNRRFGAIFRRGYESPRGSSLLSKSQLRNDFRKVLSNLDKRWIVAASHSLSDELMKFFHGPNGQGIEHILAFASFFPGEVDLSQFISDMIGRVNVYLPLSHSDGRMTFISVGSDWQEATVSGEFGIPEPDDTTGKSFNPEDAQNAAILVPGIAFDRDGNRLGRGKGFYDRFLAMNRNRKMAKIGVGWELQLIESVPSAEHDVVMDWYCYERGVIRTGATFDDE